jgi:hypothetical protein
MGLLDETRTVERQQFFNGQRLFADDLQSLESLNREMRWLHNRSLHQPGIGNGFAVRGRKGDRVVKVEPGYAIDVLGREIVLLESIELDVPPVAGDRGLPAVYDLVISYPDDSALEVVETRAGVCAPRGAVRRREQPLFCWVQLAHTEGELVSAGGNGAGSQPGLAARDPQLGADIESGLRLVIARAWVLNCQLYRDLSIAERRSARPALGPHLAAGQHTPDPWQPYWWTLEDELRAAILALFEQFLGEDQPGEGPVLFRRSAIPASFAANLQRSPFTLAALGPIILPLGLTAEVPTGQACFRTAPHYQARLEGERLLELDLVVLLQDLDLLDLARLDAQTRERIERARPLLRWTLYWDGLVSVLDPQPGSFTARLALMVQLLDIPDITSIRRQLDGLGQVLREHIEAQFRKTELGKKLEECRAASQAEREECLAEAVEMAMHIVEGILLGWIERLEWSLVWTGVEG